MSKWYTLDAKRNVIQSPDWTYDRTHKRVALTKVYEGCEVSTVFLGLDHRYSGEGPPIVFETMVFGGHFDQECERYCTWDEAVAGHARMVDKCQPILTEELK